MTSICEGLLVLAAVLGPPLSGELSEQLWDAARKGDASAVGALIAKGVDVNAKGRYDVTALHLAADTGHLEVVRLLIRHKADLNVRDTFYSSTPISWAVSKGHPEVVKELIRAGAGGVDTALAAAAARADIDLVWFLLDLAKVGRPALNRALAAAPRTALEVRDLPRRRRVAPAADRDSEGRSAAPVRRELPRQRPGIPDRPRRGPAGG
jgi:hypothetical protein